LEFVTERVTVHPTWNHNLGFYSNLY